MTQSIFNPTGSPLSNKALAEAIREQLNSESVVPDGKTGALVVHVDQSGIRSAIATKVGNGWELQQQFNYHPAAAGSGFEWGTNIIRTW